MNTPETYFVHGVMPATGTTFAMVVPAPGTADAARLQGAVYVYTRAGAVWQQLDRLTRYDAAVRAVFTAEQAARVAEHLWAAWCDVAPEAAAEYRRRAEAARCDTCRHNSPHGSRGTQCRTCHHNSQYTPC